LSGAKSRQYDELEDAQLSWTVNHSSFFLTTGASGRGLFGGRARRGALVRAEGRSGRRAQESQLHYTSRSLASVAQVTDRAENTRTRRSALESPRTAPLTAAPRSRRLLDQLLPR
jgi:hypothetical protein